MKVPPILLNNYFTNTLTVDALNRPIKQTKPDGSIIINQYNKAGLLEKIQRNLPSSEGQGSVEDYVTNINYNEKAQRTKIEYGNGTITTYTYNDKNFRLTNLKTARGSDTLQDISYIYDPEGNITEIIDVAQDVIFHNNTMIEPKSLYKYDALYRLIEAKGREHLNLGMATNNDFINTLPLPNDATALQNFTQTYEYDEIGNIKEMKSVGGQNPWTRNYQYSFDINSGDNNYLFNHDHNSSNADYLYDAHGNMTKMPHLQELFWDYTDNLKEVTLDASNNKAYYVYDANGDRVRKVVIKNTGTIIEDRFYIGDYEIYTKKTNSTLNTERETLHINDDKSKVALIDFDTQNLTTTIRYQYTNHLDSASLELDETGDIISYEEYHPFGTTSYRIGRNEVDVSLKRYKFHFKEKDNETGMHYHGARYYIPWLGRWTSVDAKYQDFPDMSPFVGMGNNPLKFIDPDGNTIKVKGWRYVVKKDFKGNEYGVLMKDGKEYTGTDKFINKSLKDINKIRATDRGKGVIDFLNQEGNRFNDFTINIKQVNWDESGFDFKNAQPFFGSVQYGQEQGEVFEGNIHTYSFVTLGHELYHAFQYYNKEERIAYSPFEDIIDDGKVLNIKKTETYAIEFANYLRDVYGIDEERLKYTAAVYNKYTKKKHPHTYYMFSKATNFNEDGEKIKYVPMFEVEPENIPYYQQDVLKSPRVYPPLIPLKSYEK